MSLLVHDKPLQAAHITEHFKPAFLQLQVVVSQPFMHLQATTFSSSGGAGSLSVVIGASPFGVLFQPHCVGGNSFSELGDTFVRSEIGKWYLLKVTTPKKNLFYLGIGQNIDILHHKGICILELHIIE